MQNLSDILNNGVLAQLATHLGVLNKSQKAIMRTLPPAMQKIVRIGNISDERLIIFVPNNAAKQKIHNLQTRILASVQREAHCVAIHIKVASHLFQPAYVYPKAEKRKISKAAAQKLRQEIQTQPEELREPFLNIIQNLEADF